MLAIAWTCCTPISGGSGVVGSSEAEGSHMLGTSAGRLRAEEEAVKESKRGTAEDSRTDQRGAIHTWVCWCVTGVK